MTGRLDTAYPDASSSPGLSLWRVTNSWQRAIRAALAPFDLTHVQFVLLASLTWMDRPAPVTQRDLARHAGTDPMMTSQVLRALERKGLITRAPHPGDRRARTLAPTPEGARLASRANAAVEAADAAYFAALGPGAAAFLAHLHTLDRAHRE
ncbi:MAG: MarR family winged helix-turn-helix transcriptional regulator [Thermoleophilia bacterium]